MKKISRFVSIILLLSCLSACTGSTETRWQEQYDLGVRYLSEGNYEEAIVAFTAAIEIDPKRAEAYVGRGDSYIGSGETEETLAAAIADYTEAINIDTALVDVYIKLAEIYVLQGNFEVAKTLLETGFEITQNDALLTFLGEITPSNFETFESYVSFESAPQAVQTSAIDLVHLASDDATWDELYYFLVTKSELNLPEFYTEYEGWKIHYQTRFVEMRQENGKAFSYDFSSPDKYVSGHTKSWNWCGDLAEYLVYPWLEDGVVRGGPGSALFVAITEDGLYDGMGYSEIYNVDDGSVWRERWHSVTYQDGYCVYNSASQNRYPNTPLAYQNPAKRVTGDYETYEEFAKNELWD